MSKNGNGQSYTLLAKGLSTKTQGRLHAMAAANGQTIPECIEAIVNAAFTAQQPSLTEQLASSTLLVERLTAALKTAGN